MNLRGLRTFPVKVGASAGLEPQQGSIRADWATIGQIHGHPVYRVTYKMDIFLEMQSLRKIPPWN